MNTTRKVQLIAGGLIAVLIIAYVAYGAYQKRQGTRAVEAMVTDTAARLGDALQSTAVAPSAPDAAATQERLEKHLAAAQEHLARLRAIDASRIRPLADTAYEYLNAGVEILRRKAAANGHGMQIALSLQALREHMKTDNRSGPWVTEAIRRKERMDRDFRDYRRAGEALAQLLEDYPVSRRRMADFVDAGLLPTDEVAASERLRTLAVVKATGEEVAKAGRLEAYR
jgi:hypothetical protein